MTVAPRRRALCAGIAEAEGREPLEFARSLAAELAGVLRGFGFGCTTLRPSTAVELGEAVFAEIAACGPEDLLVIAVIGHGELTRSGDLHVVGPDGRVPRETRVVDWVKEVENRAGGPRVLFLVDVCHAGAAARSPHQLVLPSPARATVFAACPPRSAAFDGLFTRAAVRVLREMGEGRRHIPAAHAHIPLTTLHTDIRDQLVHLVEEADGYPQEMMSSLVEFSAAAEVPEFFRNPDFDADRAAAIEQSADRALGGVLAEVAAMDPLHYIVRASGHDRTAQAGCFTGRETELAELSRWLDGSPPGALRVVTGSPGTGKSALLGVLACAAHPTLRPRTERIWTRAAHRPARNDLLAVAHARQLDVGEVFAVLAGQLGFGERRSGWTRESFRAALRGSPGVTLLIDALDEAAQPVELAADLLALTGEEACRLLVGMRPWPEFAALRHAAERACGLVDLDVEDRTRVAENVRRYVVAVLELTDPYNSVTYAPARRAYADAVAETLSGGPPADADRWGEFLVAGLCTHLFTARPEPVADVATARALGLAAPRTLPEVMKLDLADRPAVSVVLTVLAHARGEGMPVEIVRALTGLFGTPMNEADVRAALAEALFYLRQSVGDDGVSVLYRLYHQGLADHLRAGERDADILDVLLPGGDGWAAAPAYVRRNALHHAAVASRAGELLAQPEFLVHTEPATTLPQLAALPDPPAGAHVYRASSHRHALATPEQRRQILAVDAARFGERRLAGQLMRGATWAPLWATGAAVSGALRMTIPVGGARHLIDTFDLDGRPTAAISADGGPVCLWDLLSGRRIGPPAGFGADVSAVCALVVGARTVIATGHGDGTIRSWDPVSGNPVGSSETAHDRRVNALVAVRLGSGEALVSTGADGACRLWRPEAGPVTLATGLGRVNAAACTTVNGPVVVTVDQTGTAVLRSLPDGRSLGFFPGVPGFRRVGCVGADLAALGSDEVWAWNLATDERERLPGMRGHFTVLHGGAGAVVAGDASGIMTFLSAGSRDPVSVQAHEEAVTAVAHLTIDQRPVLLSAGRDGRVRLWNAADLRPSLARGAPTTSPAADLGTGPAARRAPITSLAVSAQAVAAVAGDELRLYDPRSGRPSWRVGVLPGSCVAAAGDRLWTASPGKGPHVVLNDHRARPVHVTAPPGVLAAGRLGDADVLVCGSSVNGLVEIISLTTERTVAAYRVGELSIRDLQLYPIGNRACLIVTDEAGDVLIIDLASGNPTVHRRTRAVRARAARGARVAGRHLVVTGSAEGTLRGWDLVDGSPAGQAEERHDLPITALACLRLDGRPVAVTGSLDATVAFWDLLTWQRTDVFALPDPVQRLAVTPDGLVVAAMHAELLILSRFREVPE